MSRDRNNEDIEKAKAAAREAGKQTNSKGAENVKTEQNENESKAGSETAKTENRFYHPNFEGPMTKAEFEADAIPIGLHNNLRRANESLPMTIGIDGVGTVHVGYFQKQDWESEELEPWLQGIANRTWDLWNLFRHLDPDLTRALRDRGTIGPNDLFTDLAFRNPDQAKKAIRNPEKAEKLVSQFREEQQPKKKRAESRKTEEFSDRLKVEYIKQAPLPNRVRQGTDWKWTPLKKPDLKQEYSAYTGIVYDYSKKQYWITNFEDRWIPVNDTTAKNYLKKDKLHIVAYEKNAAGPAEIDWPTATNNVMTTVTRSTSVAFASPLAGHSTGIYHYDGNRILVTDSPQIIKPVRGRWDTIQALLEEMFGPDQIQYFCGWLKLAYQSLASGDFIPGHMPIFVGAADCGKSLLQNLIITPIVGGRSAKPYQYMTAQTSFNSDLFKGEHLIISDETPATDYKDRSAFGAAIKNLVAEPMQRLHAKGKDAIMLRPFWRVSMSVNDDDESLMTLPIITDAVRDKLMVFKVERPSNLPENTGSDRKRFADALHKELPAFIYYLVNEHQISSDLQKGRFGIKEYYNPEIALDVESMSTEAEIMSMIDHMIFEGSAISCDEWEGTAGDLYDKLSSGSMGKTFSTMVRGSIPLGKMLARLSKSSGTYKGSVSTRRSSRGRVFSINRKFRNSDRE